MIDLPAIDDQWIDILTTLCQQITGILFYFELNSIN